MSGNQEQPPSSRSRKASIQQKVGEMLTQGLSQGQKMVEAGRERAQSVTEKLAAAAKDAEKLSAAMHTLSDRMQALAQQAQASASSAFETMKAKKATAATTATTYVPKGFSEKELDVIASTLLKETQQGIDSAIASYPTLVHQLNADDPDLNLDPDIDEDFLHPLAPAEVELLKSVIKNLIRSEIGVGEAVNQLIAAALVNIRSRNAATLYVEQAPLKLPPRPIGYAKKTEEARPPVPSLPRRIPSARLQGSLEDWTQAVRASGDHTDLLASMSQAFRRSVRQSEQLPTIFDDISATICTSKRGSEDFRV